MPIEKACENCGEAFFCYPSENRRFCSLACRSAFRFNKAIPAPGRVVVRFSCKDCSQPFGMMQSYLDEYHKKHGRDPLYCSRKCSAIGRKKDSNAKNTFTCINCGETLEKSRKPGGRIYKEQKYCSPKCRHEMIKKRALARFDEGDLRRHIKKGGYVHVSIPSLVTGRKHSVLEHRYVMAKHLDRDLLPEETVHHKNGNRQHNALDNLELFSSRHGPGQRVIDKVAFAIEILTLYPEFAKAAGVRLEHLTDDSPALPKVSC